MRLSLRAGSAEAAFLRAEHADVVAGLGLNVDLHLTEVRDEILDVLGLKFQREVPAGYLAKSW